MADVPILGVDKEETDSPCVNHDLRGEPMRNPGKCRLKCELVDGKVVTGTLSSDECGAEEMQSSSTASSNRPSIESAVIFASNCRNSEVGIQTSNSLLSNIIDQINLKCRQKMDNSSDCKVLTVEKNNDRDTWDKKTEFLLAVIGFAVDLGNVWRFPFICYRNGGGAFLIPYLVMLLFGGFPMFYLELALGQYYKSGCLTLWKKVCPVMKGIGYALCFVDLYMAMYYNTIIAWAVYYLFSSFTTELPWTRCDNAWNTPMCQTLEQRGNSTNATSPAQEFFERNVLEKQKSRGIDDIGPIKFSLAMCLFFVFVLVYFSLWKGVKSAGKAVWITATMPYFVLAVLLVRGVTLQGSDVGIKYYLSPQWDKLLETGVWIDAATQIFFSLGPGFGTLLALSSYNKFHNNCYRDAIFTSSVNCFTSFIAGFVIFSVLGYMANVLNKDIDKVALDGPGLVFIVYPEAIATMEGSVFWSILFFVMLITLGLDSTFGGLEAIITGLCDEYPNTLRKNREIFVAVLILAIYCCALPTTTYGGSYVVTLLDTYGTALSVLFIVLLETVTICWFHGTERFSGQIKEMLGFGPNFFWKFCWTYISPVVLLVIFSAAVVRCMNPESLEYKFPTWAIGLGWCFTFSSISCVPIYFVYCFFKTKGTFTERLHKMFHPQVVNERSSQINMSDYAQV